MSQADTLQVTGDAVVYRLFDVGYQIELETALRQLKSSAPERARPARSEAQALQIPNPPVSVVLGPERLTIIDRPRDVEISARIFARRRWSCFAAAPGAAGSIASSRSSATRTGCSMPKPRRSARKRWSWRSSC